ncbi:pseudouridine synthase, RluA family [Dictyocaulus viviparus]|uniref:Pseudouridine synthase, RluA family n=1 Tax=Dictyocaulus viviparus TaxID=29172 RepID=A0A0D8XSY3_DICVI|nr:pseudouridine synthase, RluA family [Dictyocaulus viviparus]
MPIKIIAETDDLLVIDKPPSLPVHACGQYAIHTVLNQLRTIYNRTGLRVLHRLDRTTSGVLLFAKNYETDIEFKRSLKDGTWSKEYVCMVEGLFPDEEVHCDQPIGVLVVSMGIQCVRTDGKPAHSRFKKLWSDGKRSVLSVKIHTGRTHQIRVHAQFLGYPIIGDRLYNSTAWGPQKGKGGEYQKPYNELEPEIHDFHSFNRPLYDPICLNCNVVKKQVPHDHFQIYLHCLRYSTEKWSYSSTLPDWAVNPAVV